MSRLAIYVNMYLFSFNKSMQNNMMVYLPFELKFPLKAKLIDRRSIHILEKKLFIRRQNENTKHTVSTHMY